MFRDICAAGEDAITDVQTGVRDAPKFVNIDKFTKESYGELGVMGSGSNHCC